MMDLVKNHLNADFYNFNFLENNIVKLSLQINNPPIILIYTNKSPSNDNINHTNSLKEAFIGLNFGTVK